MEVRERGREGRRGTDREAAFVEAAGTGGGEEGGGDDAAGCLGRTRREWLDYRRLR